MLICEKYHKIASARKRSAGAKLAYELACGLVLQGRVVPELAVSSIDNAQRRLKK
jgi:hypothetical protein